MFALLISTAPVYSGIADDFLSLGNSYQELSNTKIENSIFKIRALNIKESELFYRLVNSRIELDKLVRKASTANVSLLKRFRDRLQFEVSYEKGCSIR